MEDLVGKVVLVVRGEIYEAGIERITAHAADSHPPGLYGLTYRQKDRLDVWLSFGKSEGKYPGSTLGFGVTLPVKDYDTDEFLRLIKTEGERELENIQAKYDEDHAYTQTKETRQGELNVLVSRLTNSLKEISKAT